MAEEAKNEDPQVEVEEQKGAENEQEAAPKAKPGRKPQVRKSAKSEDEAPKAESKEESTDSGVRVVQEGDEIEVATEIVNGQKVATETVVVEYTPINSNRAQRRLVASKGTVVK